MAQSYNMRSSVRLHVCVIFSEVRDQAQWFNCEALGSDYMFVWFSLRSWIKLSGGVVKPPKKFHLGNSQTLLLIVPVDIGLSGVRPLYQPTHKRVDAVPGQS